MPGEAETSIVERDIRLVTELRDTRAHLHVAHISTAAALAAVRQARRSRRSRRPSARFCSNTVALAAS